MGRVNRSAGAPAPDPMPGRCRYTLALLCVAYVVSMLDRQVVSLLVEPIKADLALSDTQIGLLQGFAFAIFYALLGVPIARFADWGNRTRLIVLGLAFWSAATMACGLARGFAGLFVARICVGAGESTLSPAAYSILGDTFEQRYLGRVIGLFHMAGGIGLGLALVIGGWAYGILRHQDLRPWLDHLSLEPWQGTFIVVGLPGMLLALVILATMREPARRSIAGESPQVESSSGESVFAYIWSHRGVILPLYGGFAIFTAFIYAFLAWVPANLVRTFDLDVATVGRQFGLILLVSAGIGCVAGGWLSDHLFSRHGPAAPFRALKLVVIATIAPAVAAPLIPGRELSMVLLGVAFMGGAAAQPLVPVALQLIAPQRLRARLSAVWLCFNNLVGFGLGPLVVALFTDHVFGESGIRYALAATFLLALAPAAVAFSFALRNVLRSTLHARSADEAAAYSPGTRRV